MNNDPASYLTNANPSAIRCVDERLTTEPFTAGIQIPGGIYGIIDAVKALKNISEEDARALVKSAGLPLDAHIDEHHGPKGCGYAKLVETMPNSIGLSDAVAAADRLSWVESQHGTVLTYVGDHMPKGAVLTLRPNMTLNSPAAWQDGYGLFNLDVWALPDYAAKLGVDEKQFVEKMIDMYKKTVTTLTNGAITAFTEIT